MVVHDDLYVYTCLALLILLIGMCGFCSTTTPATVATTFGPSPLGTTVVPSTGFVEGAMVGMVGGMLLSDALDEPPPYVDVTEGFAADPA